MLLSRSGGCCLLAVFLLGLSGQGVAQEYSIEGDWRDENPDVSNGVATYTQNGSQVSVRGSFVYNGFRCEWEGSGSIRGKRVTHTVEYTRRPAEEAWRGADGRLVLTLSEDGRVLSGTWSNNNGHSGAKRLTRRGGGGYSGGGGGSGKSGSGKNSGGTSESIGAQARSIQGEWRDENPDVSDGVATYTQNGGQIRVRGSFVYNGFRCEWEGSGSISGNRVTHTVQYTRRPADAAWRGADGRFVLTLSADGRVLSGTWSNNNGDSGAKRLTRGRGGREPVSSVPQVRSIAGDWRDENPDVSHAVASYTQDGEQIRVRGSFVYHGFRCEWVGSGTINGNRVTHSVEYTRRPPDEAWRGADGRLVLTLSEDGRVLSGTWSNKNGHSGGKRLSR